MSLDEATEQVARMQGALRATRARIRTEGADFQKLRRENEQKRESWREDGMRRTAAPFSDMCDTLSTALEEARTPETSPELAHLLSGVELVRRNFVEKLARLGVGIEEFSSAPETSVYTPPPPRPGPPPVPSTEAPGTSQFKVEVITEPSPNAPPPAQPPVAPRPVPPSAMRHESKRRQRPEPARPAPPRSRTSEGADLDSFDPQEMGLLTPSFIDVAGRSDRPLAAVRAEGKAKASRKVDFRKWMGSLLLPPFALIYGMNLGGPSAPDFFSSAIRSLGGGFAAEALQLFTRNPEVWGLLSGCLLQIALPAYLLWFLLRHEYIIGGQVAGAWLAQNFTNLSIWVMGRAPALPSMEEAPSLRHAVLDLFGVGDGLLMVSSGLFVLGFTVFATVMLLPIQRASFR